MRRRNPEIEEGQVRAGSFLTHYYSVGKRGDGPPVILLHDGAWGADAYLSWSAVMRELAATHWVVAPDLLGFGKTDKAVVFGEPRHDFRIRHVADFCSAIGLESRAHFAGTSFGGSLALRAAIADAWPASTVTSIAGTGGPWRTQISKSVLNHLEPGPDYIRRVVALLTNDAPGMEEQVERRYANSLDHGHYAAVTSPQLRHPAAPAEPVADAYPASLARASCPVHIVTMRQDQLVEPDWPRHVRPVAPAIHFHEIDGPHSPNLSQPLEVAETLRTIFA
jgi:pimeloyl-ACP methyl ester carboxylesterase